MKIDLLKKYLQSLHSMEADILKNCKKNRKDWLSKVQIERKNTEHEIALTLAERRAWFAEEALKSVTEFLLKGNTDLVKQKMVEFIQFEQQNAVAR